MKLCNKIEKLITLSDTIELNGKQKKLISRHLQICDSCKQKARDVEAYRQFIQKLGNVEPELSNPTDLTGSIMNSIEKTAGFGKNSHKKLNPKTQLNFYKIAASILLFVITGFYIQQRMYVNKMILSLKASYEEENKNMELINDYNQCLEFSERFIKQQIAIDKKFSGSLSELVTKNPLINYRDYASTVCLQSRAEFTKADLELKKKMIIDFLNTERTQN